MIKGKIYIAGPMQGYPEFNYPAFFAMEERLKKAGYDVVNPASLHDGSLDKPSEFYLRTDFKYLLDCAAIVVLPGWKKSKGAILEINIGRSLKMGIFEVKDNRLIKIKDDPTKINKNSKSLKNPVGKVDWDLLPWDEVESIVKVFMHGLKKYERDNWKINVKENTHHYRSAIMRHLKDYFVGNKIDNDSKLPTLSHIATNALILDWFENNENKKRH